MSKIVAIYNIDSETWDISSYDLQSHCDLEFKFENNKPETQIQFHNLRFGFELYPANSDVQIQVGRYPENSVIVSSDQAVLQTTALTLGYEEQYEIDIWATNNDVLVSKTYEFITPRPTQPYLSWKWDSSKKQWVPPVPQPTTPGEIYSWNEEQQTWEKMQY